MVQSVDDRLIELLQGLSDRHDAIMEQLNDAAVASNPGKSIELSKEAGRIRRLVDPFRMFRKVRQHLGESRTLATDLSQDADLRELALAEIDDLQADHDARLEALKERMVTNEDAAISSLIMEIRAGTGGEEAALFARDLFEMYLRYCDTQKFKVEVIDQSASDMGGFREILLNIRGESVFTYLGYEGGGHRVQRVPKTESQGRVHTSAVTVAVLPEPEEIDIQINWEKDVEEFVSRAGGPGGQNVNKVSSAIRLVHKETGIAVSMRDDKSQHKNRSKARRIMTARLYDHFHSAAENERSAARKKMIGSGDRSDRIRTYNFPQNRCSDHRINLDLHCLDRIMLGDLAPLITALQTHDKQERLKAL
ncbi:MAG: peptide chain release factor 1 [Phycisphaerales bacterium]|nr:peptide chain release factor 1 [Phycisphaerales bacterium]